MSLWNMVGARVLVAALGHFLLKPKTRTAEDSAAPFAHLFSRSKA